MGVSGRYINPYTDFGFKKLFGSELNKELLIGFLNALLQDREQIEEITYLNTEKFGTSESDRKAVFDVYCKNERGEIFLVEMQRGEQQFFKDRSIYYSSFSIQEQGEKGVAWQYQLKAVYVISILNFSFKGFKKETCLTEVKLMNTETKEIFYDKLTYIYLEMPRFNKTEEEIESFLDKWLFVLRNLSILYDRPAALQERVFTRLFEEAEIAKYEPQERAAYEESLKVYRDWSSTVATAEQKGLAIGRAEGRAEGLAEGRTEGESMRNRELIRMWKEEGRSNEDIAALLKMSVEAIREMV